MKLSKEAIFVDWVYDLIKNLGAYAKINKKDEPEIIVAFSSKDKLAEFRMKFIDIISIDGFTKENDTWVKIEDHDIRIIEMNGNKIKAALYKGV